MTITTLALATILTVAALFGLGLGLTIATLYFWQKDPEKVPFPAHAAPLTDNRVAFRTREHAEEDLFDRYREAVTWYNEANDTKACYVFTLPVKERRSMYTAADCIPLMEKYPPLFRCHRVIYEGEDFSFVLVDLPTS